MTEQMIIARVTIPGSRNPRASGWRYTKYRRDERGRWCYVRCAMQGMYPNAYNYQRSKAFEADCKVEGLYVCDGRPKAPYTASQQPYLRK